MRRGKIRRLYDFKFGTFIGSFQSDGAASMAVKGLKQTNKKQKQKQKQKTKQNKKREKKERRTN